MQIHPSSAMMDASGAYLGQGCSGADPATVHKVALSGLERPGWVDRLQEFPALLTLDLRQYGINPQTDLSALSRLKNLRRLGLPFQTTDQHLSQLRHVLSLESVCLARCVEVTPAGIAHLASLPGLYGLRLPTGMPAAEIRQIEEAFLLLPPNAKGFHQCLSIKLIRRLQGARAGQPDNPIRIGPPWGALPLNGLNPALLRLLREWD